MALLFTPLHCFRCVCNKKNTTFSLILYHLDLTPSKLTEQQVHDGDNHARLCPRCTHGGFEDPPYQTQ